MTNTIIHDTSESQAIDKAEHIAALIEIIGWAQDEESPDKLTDEARAIITDDLDLDPDELDWDTIREAAGQHLYWLPLSIEVREGWHPYGDPACEEPAEFKITLSTGGPAVQIRGRFGIHGPISALFEHQDWGTPWTELFGVHMDTALKFACLVLTTEEK